MSRHARRGVTLVEVMIVMTVMVVAAGIFSRMVAATTRLRTVNRENRIAVSAARDALEGMRDNPFGDIFALYNPDPSDDPGGAGTAPGNLFEVTGLELLANSTTGFQLEVIMPSLPPGTPSQLEGTKWDRSGEAEGGVGLGGGGPLGGEGDEGGEAPVPVGTTWELREDFDNALLGLPRDLDGDNLVDFANHAKNYILLPILIRVEWQGAHGPRVYDIHSMLTDFIKP